VGLIVRETDRQKDRKMDRHRKEGDRLTEWRDMIKTEIVESEREMD
jgi:hypothetical protein